MEMVIRFPGGARVDAHVGEMVIKTDQPERARYAARQRPLWPPPITSASNSVAAAIPRPFRHVPGSLPLDDLIYRLNLVSE